jgi:hypothetical protein
LKKRYVIIGLLSAFLSSKGYSQSDSTYRKQRLLSKDVELLMSYYTQDNNHSAVTGGIGTESLHVFTFGMNLDWKKDSVRHMNVDFGVDIISSASTDNIDFEVSSASKTDARTHLSLGYGKFLKNNFTAGVNSGLSVESDYTSLNIGGQAGHVSEDGMREWSVNAQVFFDDLRWGRFDNGQLQKLVYPYELRYKEWFDFYRRYSYNLEFGWYQTINRRTVLGISPGIVYQSGLLSTPFHRVYFDDESLRVEKFPTERWKFPLNVQLNTFLGSKFILRTSYRFYWDDFGVTGHTFNVELPYKISPVWTLLPSVRIYTQTASDFFRPYAQHATSEENYTSDYDLSKFSSYRAGFGFRYAPFAVMPQTIFNEIELRYSYYKRSDGLGAHMLVLYIKYTRPRTKGTK